MKDISVQLELKYIQAQNLKNKAITIRFCLDRTRLTGCLVFWWSPIIFLLFRWLVPFLFTVFIEAFLLDLTAHFFFATITIRWCSTATAELPANSMGYLCCGRSGGLRLVFHWSAAWLSWPPLWWGVINFQNFRGLKLGLNFCVDFLASSELIGYVDLMDSYEILAKMFLGYQSAKACEAFLIFQIVLLCGLMWGRLANIHFANFKIDFLDNQSEYRKSLERFL